MGLACLLIALVAPVAARASTTSTDVMFVFDTSGSMGPVLDEAKSEIEQVMTQLDGSLPNVDFGIAEVRDYGGSEYDTESESDEPWQLDVPITSNASAVNEGIDDLFAGGGGDGPEAYGRALWETDTNPNVGWRPEARHLIVLVADQVPHDPNVNEGIPEEFWFESSPWDTGEELPGEWGIPGTELHEGEQLNFHAVLRQLSSDGKPLEMVDYHDTEGDFIHYWESWARTAGGEALEASENGDELATKLKQLVQAAACPTTATPSQTSPATPGTQPTALTPRFLHPGSAVALTPNGSGFCKGQDPDLGGSVVTSLEEETPSKLSFRVPATAANGLQLTSLAGGAGPAVAYGVDNFRYPWGFSIENRASTGDAGTYDGHIPVTQQDLDSVFKEIGGPGNEVYEFVKSEAESILAGGLCYGFGLLGDSLYNDAHGAGATLAYANSAGLSLSPGSVPYPLTESSSGNHALTHALLRAAASQLSPEARLGWRKGTNAASVEASLNSAFQKSQPAMLLIKFEGGGHALLAFNYQKTGSGLNVDVVDPNLPWSASDPASDYDAMQVHVNADGSWSYNGTFVVGEPFGSPVSGSSGSLYVVPQPRSPGGLTLWYNSAAPALTQVNPAPGSAITAISYSDKAGHAIPADVKPGEVVDDTVDNRLLVPTSHKLITITQTPSATHGTTSIAGRGFLDQLQTPGMTNETIETHTGGLSLPGAGTGDVLSVTSLSGGVQRTVTATFKGNVKKPTIQVSPSGQVTLTTAGGTGTVKVQLLTYSHSTGGTKTHPETVRLHGHSRIRRRTPKLKRRKHHSSSKRHKR